MHLQVFELAPEAVRQADVRELPAEPTHLVRIILLTIVLATTIIPLMTRRLQDELKQSKPFPTLEEEVYLEIQRTSQALARWITQILKPYGLTESQFNVLRILRGCAPEGISNSRIAERMVKHDPDLTRLLDRLEAGGLVDKSRGVRDRRVVNARITKAGLSVVERISEEARRTLVGALRPLGPRRLTTLADLLELVRGSASPDASLPTSARTITRTTKGGERQQNRQEPKPHRGGSEQLGASSPSRATWVAKRRKTR